MFEGDGLEIPEFLRRAIAPASDSSVPEPAQHARTFGALPKIGDVSARYVRERLPADVAEAVIRRDQELAAQVAAMPEVLAARAETKRAARKKNFFESRRREGTLIPGGYWDTSSCRWVHPALEKKSGAPKTVEGTKAMAKKAKKSNGEVASRDVSQAAGLVADFKPVRAGTARSTVVEMAGKGSGGSVDEIAKAIKGERKTVLTHLFCMNRDCAFGYEIKGDKVSMSFPGSKTWKDAIKQPVEKAA